MKNLDKRIWSILSEDEKMALGLQIALDKSSWEAGEIMNKSHYKYLEIKYRAEKFFKMFTEYFELYDVIFPDYFKGDSIVLEYFKYCLVLRLTPGRALEKINEHTNIKKSQLNSKISKAFKSWSDPENIHEFQAYTLIRDFDRWNNFRILPKDLQEPSAFKRRIKNRYKRHVKQLSNLPELSVIKLKEVCKVNKGHYFYLPLVIGKKTEIIKVRNSKRITDLLTDLSLYIFKDKKIAELYISAVNTYTVKSFRECTDGLVFWPIYRDCIKEAFNYDGIQNINPNRRHLDLALKNLQFL